MSTSGKLDHEATRVRQFTASFLPVTLFPVSSFGSARGNDSGFGPVLVQRTQRSFPSLSFRFSTFSTLLIIHALMMDFMRST